jgi:hypothetical protein
MTPTIIHLTLTMLINLTATTAIRSGLSFEKGKHKKLLDY